MGNHPEDSNQTVGCYDLLSDTEDRLIHAGLDSITVRRVMLSVRHDNGGAMVYIHKDNREVRNQAISDALRSGEKTIDIAKKAGCSVRTVRRVREEWVL